MNRGASGRASIGITVAVVLALSACGDDGPEAAQPATTAAPATSAPAQSLEATTWTLVDGADLDALDGVTVTARFEDGTVSGSSGCNQYTTTYELDGSSLSVAPEIAATRRACPDAEMAVERAYLAALADVDSFAIEGSSLTLLDAEGGALLAFEASAGGEDLLGDWTVISYYTGDAVTSVVGDVTLTATFDADTVSGDAGCNTFSGPYQVDGESITIGPLVSTRRACADEELQQQEDAYLAALQLAESYAVTGERLDLFRPGQTFAVTFQRS